MVTTYLYTFLSVAIVSLVSFAGVFALSFRQGFLRKYIFIFISVAIGALLGDAFIHLVPEAFENLPNPTMVSLLIIVGILSFLILEKILHWHHHGEDSDAVHPVGKLVLFSDALHNFMDGIIVGVSFLASVPVGIATTIAVILHEIPQEVGDFAVLVHSGYEKKRALFLNFLSALTAFLGAFTFFVIGEKIAISSSFFLPIAAGGFIYIAMVDLIPILQKTKEMKRSISQLFAVIIGVLAMLALTFLE